MYTFDPELAVTFRKEISTKRSNPNPKTSNSGENGRITSNLNSFCNTDSNFAVEDHINECYRPFIFRIL